MLKQTMFIFCFCAFGFIASAQSISVFTINSSGGSLQGANGSLMLSVGEIFVVPTDKNLLSSGFVSVIQVIDQVTAVEDEIYQAIKVFPNPVVREISVESPENILQSAVLMDLQGRQVGEYDLNVSKRIDLQNLPNGTYIIKLLTAKNQLARTFKIIKQ